MSERKVLNKYYPPDFDPNKIPKLKRPKNRQFNIRIMAPFNMRCGTCGEYIYKGKKFNSRQEKVEDEDYLGLMIFRFYIKCPLCVAEITFKTDPQNTDYSLEAGAIRNFEALRTAEILAEKEQKEKEEMEKSNPMKVLENRTKASRQEMEMLETLEELREMNSRNAKVDTEHMLALNSAYERNLARLQVEEDEAFIKSVFGKPESGTVKRLHDDEGDDDVATTSTKVPRTKKPSDILTQGSTYEETLPASNSEMKKSAMATKSVPVWQKSVGGLGSKKGLAGLVKKRTPPGGAGAKAGASATIADTKLDSSSTARGAESHTLTAKMCGVPQNDQAVSSIPLPPQPQACNAQPKGSTAKPEATNAIGTPKSSLPQAPNSKVTEQETNTEKKTDGNHGAILATSSQDGSTSLLGGSTAIVVAKPLGLGLLGAYSDTDSSEGDST